ncbi:MAG: fatty acid desaturase [Candidatus Peribacteraceae bacterium]
MSVRMYKFIIVLYVLLPLLSIIGAIFLLWNRYVFMSDLILLAALYVFTGLGITVGYHRMLTHKSFGAPEWLRGLILIGGAAGFEGSPADWAARHIEHHAHSDEEGDPHSPLHGFWHAHVGWIYAMADHKPDIQKWAPHLLQDKTVMFVSRYTVLWMILSLVIPYLIGGWTGLLWGGGVRVFLVTHVTWSVNSICHTFGRRDFETTDESRNNWLVGLLAAGEGWHNNHHAFPDSAMHGLRWWQFDGSGLFIWSMEKIGLFWDVKRIPEETQKAHAERSISMQAARKIVFDELMTAMENAQQELRKMKASGVETMQRAATDAMHRLQEIHMHVTIATHLKRQRLKQYKDELELLVQRCKMLPS